MKSKLLFLSLVFGSIAFFFAACVEEIELSSEEKNWQTLVIDGGLTDGGSPQILRLWHPARLGKRVFEAVGGAEITVHEVGGASEKLLPVGPPDSVAYHFLAEKIQPAPGRDYWLEIQLENGKTYRSQPQKMPEKIGIDSIFTRGEIVEEVSQAAIVYETQKISLFAASKKPADRTAFARYDGSLAYIFNEYPKPPLAMLPTKTCFVFDFFNRNNVVLQDFSNFSGGAAVVDRVGQTAWNWRMEWKQNWTVVQFSITPEAHEFWKNAQAVLSKTGSILDAPPGELRSNVVCDQDPTELVLGFFEVAATDTARIARFSNQYGQGFVIQEPRCRMVYNSSPPVNLPECWDCLSFPNSTLTRPWFWQ